MDLIGLSRRRQATEILAFRYVAETSWLWAPACNWTPDGAPYSIRDLGGAELQNGPPYGIMTQALCLAQLYQSSKYHQYPLVLS